MTNPPPPEVWLRGRAVPGVPPLLQPVAHALLQAQEEINELLREFPAAQLNVRPAGVAAVGFHLQHLSGVLDRLLTYARGEALTQAQLHALAAETQPLPATAATVAALAARFNAQVEAALAQLRATPESALTERRGVGRAQLPSTVLGLLVHAAEHTTRHLGQLLVTAQVAANRP